MSINDKPTTDVEVNVQGNEDTVNDIAMPSELEVLKQRATLMNIKFSNNISVEKLREKIEAAQVKDEPVVEEAAVNPLGAKQETGVKKMTLGQKIRAEQTRLIRVRIQNLDPKKKDLPGEIITVANEYMGTVRKFVPFGEVTDNGYHIPYCIYEFLKERKFINITTRKGKNGLPDIRATEAREFSIEVLPPLTEAELAQLAQAQIAAGSLND
ncbi:hypothetical protein EpBp4_0023 [Escherichia phage Bp4]|uniref:Uncharacterized protein n=2 Tax=Gamaleyavirus Bp4 TaxID=1920757 RepID=X2KRW6_9CAUD|nr:hypothetical protein EpBp4_0023 [Escherichia phage Bp4]AHN83372.1 hypothetical protein EpBp4_0023 [Escherichia phage Bp4]AXY81346.1 hypothetical protein [Escherichia phage PD38]